MLQHDDLQKRICSIENQITEGVHPDADLVEELKKIPASAT